MLDSDENMCNHEFIFSINAGTNDVMKINFTEVGGNSVVHFAVGDNFESAKGSTLINALGQTLQVGFPNSIYLSIEHDTTSDEQVEFEFWYLDLDLADDDRSVTGYNLVTKDVKCK